MCNSFVDNTLFSVAILDRRVVIGHEMGLNKLYSQRRFSDTTTSNDDQLILSFRVFFLGHISQPNRRFQCEKWTFYQREFELLSVLFSKLIYKVKGVPTEPASRSVGQCCGFVPKNNIHRKLPETEFGIFRISGRFRRNFGMRWEDKIPSSGNRIAILRILAEGSRSTDTVIRKLSSHH